MTRKKVLNPIPLIKKDIGLVELERVDENNSKSTDVYNNITSNTERFGQTFSSTANRETSITITEEKSVDELIKEWKFGPQVRMEQNLKQERIYILGRSESLCTLQGCDTSGTQKSCIF